MIMYWKIKSLHKALRNACLSYQREGSTIIYGCSAHRESQPWTLVLWENFSYKNHTSSLKVPGTPLLRVLYKKGNVIWIESITHIREPRASLHQTEAKNLESRVLLCGHCPPQYRNRADSPRMVCWAAEAGCLPGPRLWGCREDQSNTWKLTKVSFVSSRISKGSLRL